MRCTPPLMSLMTVTAGGGGRPLVAAKTKGSGAYGAAAAAAAASLARITLTTSAASRGVAAQESHMWMMLVDRPCSSRSWGRGKCYQHVVLNLGGGGCTMARRKEAPWGSYWYVTGLGF